MIDDVLKFVEELQGEEAIVMGPIASYIFANETLKYSAGRLYTKKGKKVYVTYHPDSIFTSQRIAAKFSVQFEKGIEFLKRDSEEEPKRHCTTTVHPDSNSYHSASQKLTLDIETMHHDTIDCISIVDPDQSTDHWRADIVEYPNENLNEKLYGSHLIFQNGSYDLTFMQRYMKFDLKQITFDDTMIYSRCLDPFELSSLDDLARTHVPEWSSWKQMVKHNV